jgi:hypothetical protein
MPDMEEIAITGVAMGVMASMVVGLRVFWNVCSIEPGCGYFWVTHNPNSSTG